MNNNAPARISAERLVDAARTMRVLCHPDRLRLCELLLEQRRSVGELVRETGLRQNAVSQHLTHMRAHGILRDERDGTRVYYRVEHPGAGWLLECIRTHG